MDLLLAKQLEDLIAAIIKKNVNAETFQWLTEKKALIQQEITANQLNAAFASASLSGVTIARTRIVLPEP